MKKPLRIGRSPHGMTTIRGRIVTPHAIRRGVLMIEEGRIREIADDMAQLTDYDFGDALIVPGFIDVHLHGVGGYELHETSDILKAAAVQVRFGTTAFLPTSASLTEEGYIAFGRNVREARSVASEDCAEIVGAHFEGPFINPVRKGGMRAEFLRAPSLAECRRYLEAAGDAMALMTLSPELEGAHEVIRELCRHGVVVSIGHTDAAPEDLQSAIDAGARSVCHLFDTFDHPIQPRGVWPPTLIASVLANDALSCEVICDMRHVLPEYVKICARVLQPDRFIAITDSMLGAAMPPGEYAAASGQRYHTHTGVARRCEDNVIVGSVLTMNRAFGNLVTTVGLDPCLAARFCATNAAKLLGRGQEQGRIEPEMRADLAVLNAEFECVATFVQGRLAYKA